jgi:protocatechuate 3,4-dioxygenase beta subunit
VFAVVVAAAFAQQAQPDPGTISGKIVAVGGQPLRKASVSLRPAAGSPVQAYSSMSDAEGNFTIASVAPGRYQMWVERAGYLPQPYGAKYGSGIGSILSVAAGQQIKDLVIELTPHAAITGKVLDEDGDPVARSFVTVMKYGYIDGKRQLYSTQGETTDDNGDFRITGLAPGRYYLAGRRDSMSADEVSASSAAKPAKPEEDYVTTWYSGTTDPTAATPVEIVGGQSVGGIDIQLRKAPVLRIKGKLVGASDLGSERVRVVLSSADASATWGADQAGGSVMKDGTFTITHVRPGSYNIVAAKFMGRPQVLGRQHVEVGNRNLEDVIVTVQPLITLRGTARTEGDDKPVTSVHIRLVPMDATGMGMNMADAKDDGTFVLSEVPAGKYRVIAFGKTDGMYLKSMIYGNEEVQVTGVDLDQGAAGPLTLLYSAKGAQVEGTVQVDGKPVQAAIVTLIPESGAPSDRDPRYRLTTVDQNGRFLLRDVAPGQYGIYAWEDLEEGVPFDTELMKLLEKHGAKLSPSESGRERVGLERISTAAVQDAHRRSGR